MKDIVKASTLEFFLGGGLVDLPHLILYIKLYPLISISTVTTLV